MLIVVILIAFAAWTGGVYYYASSEAVSSFQVKEAKAQAELEAKDKQLVQQAGDEITHMSAAFDAGQAKAKTVYIQAVSKGQIYVANTPVFSNPVCVVPDDGMQQLASARSGVYAAAAPSVSDAAVPRTGADPGRKDVVPVPAAPAGQRPVAPMHPKPRPLN